MHAISATERTLTELDFQRLRKFAAALPAAFAEEVECADLVASQAVAPDVVTVHSRIEVIDADAGAARAITLCWPTEANADTGHISVLSPVGASLLGLRVGATAHWLTPLGGQGQARIAAMLFQPEAHGDFTA